MQACNSLAGELANQRPLMTNVGAEVKALKALGPAGRGCAAQLPAAVAGRRSSGCRSASAVVLLSRDGLTRRSSQPLEPFSEVPALRLEFR